MLMQSERFGGEHRADQTADEQFFDRLLNLVSNWHGAATPRRNPSSHSQYRAPRVL
jgi:hypothetical protein